MSLLHDILAFVGAVLRYWVVLVSGGAITTLITIIERARGNAISPKVYWPIIVGFVGAAVFLAWRTERQRWERLSASTLSLSPRELLRIYDGRTDVQGQTLATAHKNKWIELSGALGDVSVYSIAPFTRMATVTFQESSDAFLKFSSRWIPSLTMLQRGDKITVVGQVEKVERHHVWLRRCELLNVSPPEKKVEKETA